MVMIVMMMEVVSVCVQGNSNPHSSEFMTDRRRACWDRVGPVFNCQI